MTKKLIAILALSFLIISCQPSINKEIEKTAKARAASDRINSSDSDSKDILKELDE